MEENADLPVYPARGAVTASQRTSAELERTKIRQENRKQRIDERAEALARAFQQARDDSKPRTRAFKRKERRAIQQMFGIAPDTSDEEEGEVTEDLRSGEDAEESGEESEYSNSAAEKEHVDDDEEEGSSGAASEDESEVAEDAPNLHRTQHQKMKSRQLSELFKIFPTNFVSWQDFHEAFQAFQVKTYQHFSKRTSTSVAVRNNQIRGAASRLKRQGKKQRKEVRLLPEEWGQYSKTLVCTHGQPYQARGKGKRKHEKVRDTECSARVNARVTATLDDSWVLRVTASGYHNHELNEHVWEEYSGNRTVTEEYLQNDVNVLRKAGASAKGILQYLRERTGKKTKLKDVHNMIQRQRIKDQAGLNDAQRALAVLDEFCRQNGGNSAEIVVDSETEVARIVTFQTAKMKRLFNAFPEVVLVDSTHDTNANRYKLFSFVVHDVFGKGQYVHHALVESEHKVNLRRVIEIFKKNNPGWEKVRVFMTDKAMHEKTVLKEEFPQARQLLCQWHVVTWLKKQATRLASSVKKQVKAIMGLLVYARSKMEYDEARSTMKELLGSDEEHPLYQTFLDNWDNSQDEWVSYLRGNVPHLTNNTNNRIESKWGKIKDVIKGTCSIDELVTTLITLQEYAEDQYIAEYHRVGSRPRGADDDPELAALAMQISPFAFRLVEEQHGLATSPNTHYSVELLSPGKAVVMSSSTGVAYEVNIERSRCKCIFTETCLLPCRHVMHARIKLGYETVIPPMKSIPARWIVHSAVNNIAEGDVAVGGLLEVSAAPLPKATPVSASDMYIQSKALTEKIVDCMALQTTPTYSVAYKWLEDFYTALTNGHVVDFARNNSAYFPGLSQVSSVGAATLSQMSFADQSTQMGASTQSSDEEVPPTQRTTLSGSTPSGLCPLDNEGNDNEAASSVASVATTVVPCGEDVRKDTETSPKVTESGDINGGRLQWKFAERPLVHGMTKAQRRQQKKKEERQLALDLAEKYRSGKVTTPAKLEDVARMLDGPFSLFHAKPMVDTLMLPFVNVQGKVRIQLLGVGESIPAVKAIPQLEQVMEALCAMELRPKNVKLLAYWPDYGYLTKDQLENMRIVHEANKQFILVMKTTVWIDTVEWTIKDLYPPFDDTNAVTKSEYKGYIETLNLGVNKFENEEVEGYKLLDFRENLWLHSTSILMGLLTLRSEYPGVGIVDPSYHDFAAMKQKRSVAKGLGAADPRYERVLGIFNVGNHWVAFMIDKNTKICHMFDPLQYEQNYAAIERSVSKVMEPVLDLEGKLVYKKVDWCKQQDGSSCGIWCIAVLEMLVVGASWNDKIYRLQPYLRMRYLYKVIGLLMKPVA